MRNLDQIRAFNALACAREDGHKIIGPNGGGVVKKISPLILNNGLMATAAYAFTQKEGWQLLFNHLARHLADKEIGIIPQESNDHRMLMDFLAAPGTTSETLKLATAEAMAWLIFAKRFIPKPEKAEKI